ncbi:FecCD family ABC transporter permease [Pseudaeromonas sharmana]|uniref:FecCD family ABC transporter permease n=1 Tax=Pseudaeromonas sharmana TaxID=328412 RepID=A0ABV8CQ77_9GAMM
MRLPLHSALPLLGIPLLLVTLISLYSGALPLSLAETWQALWRQGDSTHQLVIWQIRLPRSLMAIAVGALLALSGAVLQGLFRNPLADPGIIGVSGGAALGAGLAIVLLPTLSLPWLTLGSTTLLAFVGGMLTTLLVYRLGRGPFGTSMAMMLLAGVAVGAIAFSVLGLLNYVADDEQLRDLSLWQMGSLAGASWPRVILALLMALLFWGWSQRQAGRLNALLLGEAEARHLGVAVERLKRNAILVCALAVGISVAAAGMIGFIGLMVPHLVRLISGPDYRRLLPLSALGGALLLLFADLLARQLAPPAEIPVGLITALIGAPFFIWLLHQQRGSRP